MRFQEFMQAAIADIPEIADDETYAKMLARQIALAVLTWKSLAPHERDAIDETDVGDQIRIYRYTHDL